MNVRAGKAYFAVPVLYVAIMFGLLMMQFSGGERITRSVEELILQAARRTVGSDESPLVDTIRLTFNGIGFEFLDGTGVTVVNGESAETLAVVGFHTRDNGFDVEFAGGVRLVYATQTEPNRELQFRVVLPATVRAERVIVPFSLAAGTVSESASPSYASLRVQSREFLLTVPPRAAIDLASNRIVIESAALGEPIRYMEASTASPAQVAAWFGDPARRISEAAYASSISRFTDAAYSGWSSGRLNTTALTWSRGNAGAAFTEEALVAYLAEAWVRDDYDRAFAEMRRARDLHPHRLGMLSAAYLGGLELSVARTRALDEERSVVLTDRVTSADMTVFRDPTLLSFAANRGSEGLYASILALAAAADVRTIDVESAAGLLLNLIVPGVRDERIARIAADRAEPIAERILASISRHGDSFFIQTAPGQLDLTTTLIAGVALDRYAEARTRELYTTAGRNLVTSALERADRFALIPAALTVRGDDLVASQTSVMPESVYPIIAASAAYPRLHSFYDRNGAGSWVLSIVPIDTVRMDATEWRFVIEYPRLRTFYLVFAGVPAFDRMELFGLTWRNAPDFEIYSKGRHYDPSTRTLFVKYYDDSTRREIVLHF